MASKRGKRRKACVGKQRLGKEAALIKAGRTSRRVGLKVNAYKCPHCGFYHQGHAPTHVQKKLGFK